ncbi:hypothetical protein STEG23_005465 [Scotinomys teguina]
MPRRLTSMLFVWVSSEGLTEEGGAPTLQVSSTSSHWLGSWTEEKGESEKTTVIHLSLLLPDCGCHVTITFLLPCLPRHDGLCLKPLISQEQNERCQGTFDHRKFLSLGPTSPPSSGPYKIHNQRQQELETIRWENGC